MVCVCIIVHMKARCLRGRGEEGRGKRKGSSPGVEVDGLATPEDLFKLELPSHRKHKRYRTPQATIPELLGGETKTQTQTHGPRKEIEGQDTRPLVGAIGIKQRHTPPNPRKRKSLSGSRTPQHRTHKKARLKQSTINTTLLTEPHVS